MKHTFLNPGVKPAEDQGGLFSCRIQNNDFEDADLVAHAYGDSAEEATANARLIAAAPELLEALEKAFIALGRLGGNVDPETFWTSEVDKAAGRIAREAWLTSRAAIAKAEGRTNG